MVMESWSYPEDNEKLFKCFISEGWAGVGWGLISSREGPYAFTFHVWLVPEKGLFISRERGLQGISALPQSKNTKCTINVKHLNHRSWKSCRPWNQSLEPKTCWESAALDDVLSKTGAVNPYSIKQWVLGPTPHCDFTSYVEKNI